MAIKDLDFVHAAPPLRCGATSILDNAIYKRVTRCGGRGRQITSLRYTMRVLNQPTMLFDDHEDARRDDDLFDFTEDDFTDEEQAAIRDRIDALIAEVGGQY
jgi:hypothetical protein